MPEMNMNVSMPAADSQPPIAAACQYLNNVVDDLHDEILLVIEKIGPVLGPNPGQGETPMLASDAPKSDLAAVIEGQANRIADMINNLRAVRYRIEL